MIQLYFLSILCNGFSGYLLFSGSDNGTAEKMGLSSPTFHLVLGIMSAVVGVLKLLSPTMDGIPILGDLFPSVAGVTAGFLLIFGIYRNDMSSASQVQGAPERFGASLLRFRKFIGLGLIAVALLHFLFPQTLFL